MKKFFILLAIFIIGLQVFAKEENLGFRGPLNFIQSKVLERIITNQIKKNINGNIKTHVNSYGAKALRNGIFKTAKIKGENICFKNITINQFWAETTTENNRLDISNKSNPKLLTDIQANYKAIITNDDLKTIITAPVCQNEITRINKKLAPFANINNIDIFCTNEHLKFKINMISPLFDSEFYISGSTKIQSNGEITELKDFKFNETNALTSKAIKLINKLNPINFVIKELNNAQVDIKINKINIIDDKIEIFGIIKIYRGV